MRDEIHSPEPTKCRYIRKEARSVITESVAESPGIRDYLSEATRHAGQGSSAGPDKRQYQLPATDRFPVRDVPRRYWIAASAGRSSLLG
jgi:hypothetical protein